MTLSEWHETLFDVKEREFTRFEVTRPFKIPGLLYVQGAVKVQGVGYRDLQPGQKLLVRFDGRNPDLVDVSFFAGRGEKEHVYALTESEWGWVKLRVREIPEEEK